MNTEQSASTGTSERTIKEEDDIIKLILNRVKGFKDTKFSDKITDYVPKLLVAFVSMMSFLMTYQINTTSSYIGSGLRVPSHNVGIFVAKLISYRSFLMMVGLGFAYLIEYICTLVSKEKAEHSLTRKVISLFFLYLLLASRWCLLFSSFLTKNLSYNVYFCLSIEAVAAGAFQMSLILLIPQFIFITFLSIHLLALLFFLTQFVFDFILSNKPLIMLRIQFSMCLIVTYIGIGLWAFYLFHYHDNEPKYYNEELYKQNESTETLNSIYEKLKDLSKKVKEILENKDKKFDYWMYEDHDAINELINIRSIILEITNSINDFVKLLMKLLDYISESKDKVEKIIKPNKSNLADGKNKNNFSTQKNNHIDSEFLRKVNELNKLFNEFKNNDNNLSNVIGKLSNFLKTLEFNFKKFTDYRGSENINDLCEEIISLISKYNKSFETTSKIGFNLHDSSKNPVSLNELSLQWKKDENEINEKIKTLLNSNENLENFRSEINKYDSDLEKITKLHKDIIVILFKKYDHILFCYVMIAVACFFRDFLYPSTIPHALLVENEAQKILLLGIILQLLFCFPVFILDDLLHIFTLLMENYFNYFWTLVGPPFIVLIFTFLAIHTKISFFHLITGSTGRVFILILFLIPFYTLMESVSYACVSHYVFYHLGFSDQNLLFLLVHQLLEMFCTYFFSKLSAGYNHARVRLGHCLPTYTTNYEMTFCQEFWSMLKWILQYTFKDILFFFSTNIRQYL